MLEAFIIDQIQKKKERAEKWERSHITIPLEKREEEIPVPVKDEPKIETVIKF